MAYIHKAKEKK